MEDKIRRKRDGRDSTNVLTVDPYDINQNDFLEGLIVIQYNTRWNKSKETTQCTIHLLAALSSGVHQEEQEVFTDLVVTDNLISCHPYV